MTGQTRRQPRLVAREEDAVAVAAEQLVLEQKGGEVRRPGAARRLTRPVETEPPPRAAHAMCGDAEELSLPDGEILHVLRDAAVQH